MRKIKLTRKWLQLQLQLQNKFSLLILLAFVFVFVPLSGQMPEYNHPELTWKTIKTEHFEVHFHNGTLRTAELVAEIAEEVYPQITELYNFKPDTKVHFIIKDYDDNSNGASYYYDNKIEIWAPPMNFHLRGTHNWLRDVVTHEFTHIVSLGAAMKFTRRIPAVYLQYISYEKEKRKDVIHGYPDRIVSLPVAGTSVPMWFAEGMAQYQRKGIDFDWWDSFRDMVLRDAVLNNNMLSPAEMEVFGSSSLRNELVYNQGLALVTYISRFYGEEKIAELAQAMGSVKRMSFSSACKKVLGKTEKQLYSEWKAWLKSGYKKGTEKIRQNLSGYDMIFSESSGNFYPVFNSDGSKVLFLTNRGSGYFSVLNLALYDFETGKVEIIAQYADLTAGFSPDNKKIIFGRKHRVKHGSNVFDLFVLDLKTRKEKLLTRNQRARSPVWSADGKKIVCVTEKDGTSNLVLMDPEGKNRKQITDFSCGEKIYTPRFFPQSNKIVFTLSKNGVGRDIAVMDISGENFNYLVKTLNDERDAFPSPDGRYIYFSSDATGIFNIYKYDIKTHTTEQLTNVLGGAFMPCVNSKGEIVFSLFHDTGYNIAFIKSPSGVSGASSSYLSPFWKKTDAYIFAEKAEKYDDCSDRKSFGNYSDYEMTYSKMLFFPRLVYDFPGEIKAGAYFTGSDVLDRFSVIGGAAINRIKDADIFSVFTYRRFAPTLFLEIYHQIRHTSELDSKFRFDLTEVDLGGDIRLGTRSALRTFYSFTRYNAGMTFKDRGIEHKFTYTYHIGNRIGLKYQYIKITPARFSRIAPNSGLKTYMLTEHAWNRFLKGFEVNSNYGTIVEQYDKYSFNRYELKLVKYLPGLSYRHGIMAGLKAGVVDAPVDDFYNFFAGGLDGLKGYPFYSIEGTKFLQFDFSYRAVLFSDMKLRMGFLQLRDMALSMYAQAGNAWSSKNLPDMESFKKDAGVQFRLTMNAFYSFPMCFYFDVSYGFDKFVNKKQQYGGEYRTYMGLMFDFPD